MLLLVIGLLWREVGRIMFWEKDGYECTGLSNSLFHNEWPKVKMGKELLRKLKEEDIQDEEKFIEKCFELLSYVPSKS